MLRSTQSIIAYFFITLSGSTLLYYALSPYHHSLHIVEHLQLALLAIGGFISLYLAYKQSNQKFFWLWSATWWLVLLGRSINWGRLYWPEYPKIMYRSIGATIILGLIIPLLIPKTRQQIFAVIQKSGIPIQQFILVSILFFLVDQVDGGRYFFLLLQKYTALDNVLLFEEIVETFFIGSLFSFISFYKKAPN